MELSKLNKMNEIWCAQIQSGSFYNLSKFYIKECDSVEYVFTPYMFRYLVHLQYIFIENCPNLKEIWCGQIQSGSFNNLFTLIIEGCDSLEYVFNSDMAQRFSIKNCPNLKEIVNGPLMIVNALVISVNVNSCNQLRNVFQLSTAVDTVDLEDLFITKCGSMEEVISWEGRPQDSTNNLLFPKLDVLNIRNASSLVCFCIGAMQIEFQQLSLLYLHDIPAIECLVSISNENSLKPFFPHKVLFPSLVKMELYKLKNMKDIWCGQLQVGSFNNLSTLYIEECDSLEYVFSPCTARYLMHLLELTIFNCKNLKEVVSAKKEVDGIDEYTRSIFPKLEKVKLYKLLSLERFYHVANEIEFPKLFYIGIVDCHVFESFSPGFVYTPILDHVNLDFNIYGSKKDEVTMWKGNLNSTIQHLHEDQQQRRRQNKPEDEEKVAMKKKLAIKKKVAMKKKVE